MAGAWTPAAPATVERSHKLASLLATHTAYAKATRSAAKLRVLQARRPLTGGRTVLPVLGRKTAAHGVRWLHVRLPGRPNGRTGWIRASGTVASTTPWTLVVQISKRRVVAYRSGRAIRTFPAVVGAPSTPTPRGESFVEESIRLSAGDVGAPFALALSSRSNVFQEFAGGPGQIALHGLENVGGVLGTATSHGCVRLGNAAMRWLVYRVGPGAPVTITR